MTEIPNAIVVNHTARKLRTLPVQLIEAEESVILKRGATALKIRGAGSAAAVRDILVAAREGIAREEILLSFAETDRAAVDNLVEQLLARRILMWIGQEDGEPDRLESSVDVFFWNFGTHTEAVAKLLDRKHIAIVGVNYISRRLSSVLVATGVSNFKVVDYLGLRNVRLFNSKGALQEDNWNVRAAPLEYREWARTLDADPPGCLVVTSDFGGAAAIREWNRHCVEQKWHFLPILLSDLMGYIGPLVIPGQTACYECLRARQNSHLEDPAAVRGTEERAFAGQYANGFHPSMASVLGDMAAMELTKFYSESLPLARVGILIEINLMVPSLVRRTILKIPRCTVCSKMNTRSSSALEASANMHAG